MTERLSDEIDVKKREILEKDKNTVMGDLREWSYVGFYYMLKRSEMWSGAETLEGSLPMDSRAHQMSWLTW